MAETTLANSGAGQAPGLQGIVADWASDQRAFKHVSWGKAMMWIFLLSDTFVFGCFLLSYMTARISTRVPWPNPSEVFALEIGGAEIPLILIAIMTFVLISSSGTMAMAVMFGYRRDRRKAAILMLLTAALGATFVGMQAFEWTKLITEGVRPWGNPWGAAQFGSSFFMITGFHGTHVTIGVIFLIITARKVWRGDYDTGPAVSSRADAAITKASRSWGCTGTSSIWCGCSSSLSSIFGERQTWLKQPWTATANTRRTTPMPSYRPMPTRNIRSNCISWCGAGCSCSAPARTPSIISACRAIPDGR